MLENNNLMIQQEPRNLWKQFLAIAAIPHASGNLSGISSYVTDLAVKCGFNPQCDAAGNILVCLSEAPTYVLQAHLDMVPQVADGVTFDFSKDSLQCRQVESDADGHRNCLMATGTTLGADNGIGVAAMLALMEEAADKPTEERPAIELLFTTDEETGMTGARGLQENWLKADKMINLDTEEAGVLMTGCAGAVNISAVMKYRMDNMIPEGDQAIRLTISGLQGGHSGMDIHLFHANACKLMNRFLKHAVVNYEARVASIDCGTLRNAIPRFGQAVITVPSEVVDEIIEEVRYYQDLYHFEFKDTEPDLQFVAEPTSLPAALLPEEIQDDLLNAVEACHDGVWRWGNISKLEVDTSSNLATLKTTPEGTAEAIILVRSMDEERKRALASSLHSAFLQGGARVEFCSAYGAWNTPDDAPLVRHALAIAESQQLKLSLSKVHCGLECGVISEKYPQLQIISIGPSIHHPHSPQESVEIDSVADFWQLLCGIISSK